MANLWPVDLLTIICTFGKLMMALLLRVLRVEEESLKFAGTKREIKLQLVLPTILSVLLISGRRLAVNILTFCIFHSG